MQFLFFNLYAQLSFARCFTDYLFTLATRVDETNESWTTEQNANFLKRDSPSSKEKKDLLRYPKENANKSPHRKARFLGRLAILAGLDGFPSPFKPQSDKSPPNRISPFFAAYYDPFPAISQVYPALVGVTPTTQTDGPLTPELDQVNKNKLDSVLASPKKLT